MRFCVGLCLVLTALVLGFFGPGVVSATATCDVKCTTDDDCSGECAFCVVHPYHGRKCHKHGDSSSSAGSSSGSGGPPPPPPPPGPKTGRRIQFWICGAFCDQDQDSLSRQLRYIQQLVPNTTHVSVGSWNLGSDGVSIEKASGYVPFAANIKKAGFVPVGYVFSSSKSAMLNSFSDPDTFATNAIHAAKECGYEGFELDWEPADSSGEGEQYAKFLGAVSRKLQSAGLFLSADILTSGPFFSFSDIAQQTKGTNAFFSDMNTYEKQYFDDSVQQALTAFGLGPISIGVDVDTQLSPSEIEERYQFLEQENVCQISLWTSEDDPQPYYKAWSKGLNALAKRCT